MCVMKGEDSGESWALGVGVDGRDGFNALRSGGGGRAR